MADAKIAYSASSNVTITLQNLASTLGTARESDAIDNTTNKYFDALIMPIIKLSATGSPAGDKTVNIYAYGSEDGTVYTDNATGSNNNITLRSPTCLKLVGVVACPDSNVTYEGGPFSVAYAFGGVLPKKWGLVVENRVDVAFANDTDSRITYTGIYSTV